MQQSIDLKRFIAYDSANAVKVIADSINIKLLFTKLWANKPESAKLDKIIQNKTEKHALCLFDYFFKNPFFMYHHQYIVL